MARLAFAVLEEPFPARAPCPIAILLRAANDNAATTYDLADRFSSAGPSAASVTAAYDTLSRVNGLTRGAGAGVSISTIAHDFADRMSGLSHVFTPTSGNETWAFAYADAGQLASSTGSRASWDWQATPAAPVATTPNGLNQNATVGAASWTYDKNGNLTSDGTRTFTYDPENRLIGESGPVSLTLAYGGPSEPPRASATPARSPSPRPGSITTRRESTIQARGSSCRPIRWGIGMI
jgi:hypothetical protein